MFIFIAGVLVFSVIVPMLAYFVSKSENQDKGKIATSLSLVAWGSMLIGLLLAKVQH
jgi:formate-dependent nitrite reductase membrane component NrfD